MDGAIRCRECQGKRKRKPDRDGRIRMCARRSWRWSALSGCGVGLRVRRGKGSRVGFQVWTTTSSGSTWSWVSNSMDKVSHDGEIDDENKDFDWTGMAV